jgi:hypothetical protein
MVNNFAAVSRTVYSSVADFGAASICFTDSEGDALTINYTISPTPPATFLTLDTTNQCKPNSPNYL